MLWIKINIFLLSLQPLPFGQVILKRTSIVKVGSFVYRGLKYISIFCSGPKEGNYCCWKGSESFILNHRWSKLVSLRRGQEACFCTQTPHPAPFWLTTTKLQQLENAQWRKVKQLLTMWLCSLLINNNQASAAWNRTVEKSQTNAISVTLLPFFN